MDDGSMEWWTHRCETTFLERQKEHCWMIWLEEEEEEELKRFLFIWQKIVGGGEGEEIIVCVCDSFPWWWCSSNHWRVRRDSLVKFVSFRCWSTDRNLWRPLDRAATRVSLAVRICPFVVSYVRDDDDRWRESIVLSHDFDDNGKWKWRSCKIWRDTLRDRWFFTWIIWRTKNLLIEEISFFLPFFFIKDLKWELTPKWFKLIFLFEMRTINSVEMISSALTDNKEKSGVCKDLLAK